MQREVHLRAIRREIDCARARHSGHAARVHDVLVQRRARALGAHPLLGHGGRRARARCGERREARGTWRVRTCTGSACGRVREGLKGRAGELRAVWKSVVFKRPMEVVGRGMP